MSAGGKRRLAALLLLTVAVLAACLFWVSRPPAPAYIQLQLNGADGSRKLVAATARESGPWQDLAPGFSDVQVPVSSFDGQSLLFAGKQGRSDPWQVWEVRRDGRRLHRVTHQAVDCMEPHYLPGGSIVYCRGLQAGNALFVCDADGSHEQRITFNSDPIQDCVVLPEGRIAFNLRGTRVVVNADGSGVSPYTGSPEELEAARAAEQVLSPTAPRPVPTGHVGVSEFKKNPNGLLFCLSVYNSDRPGLNRLPEGSVRTARFLTATGAVLGDATVSHDGSLLVRVVGDRAFRLQLLDASGRVLAEEPNGLWLRPNESRGCIGCHESHDVAPENLTPAAEEQKPQDLTNPRR